MFFKSPGLRELSIVEFTGSFNAKTAATTGLRKDSVFQNVLEILNLIPYFSGTPPNSVYSFVTALIIFSLVDVQSFLLEIS